MFPFDRVEKDDQQIEGNQDRQQDEQVRGDASADAEQLAVGIDRIRHRQIGMDRLEEAVGQLDRISAAGSR